MFMLNALLALFGGDAENDAEKKMVKKVLDKELIGMEVPKNKYYNARLLSRPDVEVFDLQHNGEPRRRYWVLCKVVDVERHTVNESGNVRAYKYIYEAYIRVIFLHLRLDDPNSVCIEEIFNHKTLFRRELDN